MLTDNTVLRLAHANLITALTQAHNVAQGTPAACVIDTVHKLCISRDGRFPLYPEMRADVVQGAYDAFTIAYIEGNDYPAHHRLVACLCFAAINWFKARTEGLEQLDGLEEWLGEAATFLAAKEAGA